MSPLIASSSAKMESMSNLDSATLPGSGAGGLTGAGSGGNSDSETGTAARAAASGSGVGSDGSVALTWAGTLSTTRAAGPWGVNGTPYSSGGVGVASATIADPDADGVTTAAPGAEVGSTQADEPSAAGTAVEGSSHSVDAPGAVAARRRRTAKMAATNRAAIATAMNSQIQGKLEEFAGGLVVVKVPTAASPPVSVAVTVVPDVSLGTTNVQLNAPVLFVVREPLAQLTIGWESKTSDARRANTEKPVPTTVTVAPVVAWVGFTVMEGVVIVKVIVVVRMFVDASVAMTEYAPAGSLGTLNVQTNRPEESVVIAVRMNVPSVHTVGTWSAELNDTVAPEEGVNPEPVRVKFAPSGPWAELVAMTRVLTVTPGDGADLVVSGVDALSVTWSSKE